MLTIQDKTLIFRLERCVQCGACLAACDQDALQKKLGHNGLHAIHINKEACTLCGRCVAVCPARKLPDCKLAWQQWDQSRGTFLASAKDQNIRKNASSGGVARVLLAGSLEKGIAEKVYGLGRTDQYPWASGRFFTTPIKMTEIPNSMYLPVLAMENCKLNSESPTVLLIGTACQLLAGSLLLKKTAVKLIKIAIICKQQKTLAMTRFTAKRVGVKFHDGQGHQVSYRSPDWPGQITIDGKSIPWEVAAALPYGKRLWRVPGCRSCPATLGVDADITLADPWGIDQIGTPGQTMVMVWTDQGRSLLEAHADLLNIAELPASAARESIGWDALLRRQPLVDYYAGRKVGWRIKAAGLAERLQTQSLETILDRFRLPEAVYKLLAHLPDLANIL